VALLYNARLTPSKLELLAAWAPTQPWWAGPAPREAVGAYRFDDPANAVGIETHLLDPGDGQVAQIPLTYRDAPLEGAEAALVGTTQHSVLGLRWVYDGCADPVYATALATAILTGAVQAELQVESDGELFRREPTTRVVGSGTPGTAVPPIEAVTSTSDVMSTTIVTPDLELVVRRRLVGDVEGDHRLLLAGIWPGNDEPVILALARMRR
jgi:hypothetical protein